MSGYSKTPLWKKLGIKNHFHGYHFQLPDLYWELLQGYPEDSTWSDKLQDGPFDFMHVFIKTQEELTKLWPITKVELKKTGTLWVSWPKKTSEIPTNINGNMVREIGLSGGLVDVKVCAVDEDWSGLKFVFRKEDR